MNDSCDTILEVQGMTCPSCIRHVTAALTDLDGVEKVDVKVREGVVVVKHDAAQASISALIGALDGAGYLSRPRVQDATGQA
ncbi:MAG: heavy-metal-associated domain-containing protein [Kofleriaceae bacterium]